MSINGPRILTTTRKMNLKRYETTLVIGDAHDEPGKDQSRFTALGNYIVATRPDNIVQIGDWGSYESVSFHNRGRPLLQEGRRLIDDIRSAQIAYEVAFSPLWQDQHRASSNKRKRYVPNVYWLEANHEYRIKRYIMENPVLQGYLPETDLVGAGTQGATIVPWKSYCHINGVAFTHIPSARRSPNPIGGEFVTRRAADYHDSSIVFGHTHRLLVHDNARIREGRAHLTHAINVGWFGDYVPEYIESEANLDWWAGLVTLTHTDWGQVDISTINMNRLKKEYL